MLPLFVLCLAAAALGNMITDFGKNIKKEVTAISTPIESVFVGIGSSQCSNVKKLIGVSYEKLKDDDMPDLNSLKLEYKDEHVRVIFNIADAAKTIVHSKEYNKHKKLIVYVHGFTDDPTKAGFGNISDVFLDKGECNVLALDGSSLIKWLYLRSTSYVRFMGEKLGEVLASMVIDGVDPASIHIIGHSLGAHISGFTGKQFTHLTGKKIGRISGLDPAGPCFSHIDDDVRLNSTDADFVDVIHSDAGVYGMTEDLGQVDYYPNSGSQQPNCLFQSCSHSRAWLYFAESVTNERAFPALKCKDWDAFKKGNCEEEISNMGYASKPGTNGKYFLQTNDQSPFGLGEKGIKFKNNEGLVRNIGDSVTNLFG